MQTSNIFIASSGRTLNLAEQLQNRLKRDFCQATLWSEVSRNEPGATIIEMLQQAARDFDFAVVLLARDDVMLGASNGTQKARDNCIFEAGLFMAALGRDRCFLVNSVAQRDLPTDLGGIISLPFKEPDDLTDLTACANAMQEVSALILPRVQKIGKSTIRDSFKDEVRKLCCGG